ncbi:unnamed protein product [Owenia fusiformis]|uniref:N-acetyltransferase domain-containing protein n=1 Tax=Owenia fusiformis TaxID=6347 RepID=A0A8S4Q4K0_OWEFU|nr:unnamed protein product [Owenia fusiformis]
MKEKRAAPATVDGVLCRIATQGDYQAVLDINRNVYNGLDYLSSKYHEYLNDPRRNLGVAIVDGRIVVFEMAYVIDGDTSITWQARRVHKDFQGLGLSNKLGHYLQSILKERYPKLKREHYTSANWPLISKVLSKRPKEKLVMKRPRVSFDTNPTDLNQILKNQSKKQEDLIDALKKIHVLSIEEGVVALKNCDWSSLFPTGFLIANWEPYMIQYASNYPLFLQDSTMVATRDKSGQVESISFGTIINSPAALRYRADYYGNSEQDAIHHIVKHAVLISQLDQKRDISYSILLPETLDKQAIKDFVVTKMGLTNQRTDENLALLISLPPRNFLSKM